MVRGRIPWEGKSQGVLPRASWHRGKFVAAMKDVLELYAEPCESDRPVVCFDETSTQLLSALYLVSSAIWG